MKVKCGWCDACVDGRHEQCVPWEEPKYNSFRKCVCRCHNGNPGAVMGDDKEAKARFLAERDERGSREQIYGRYFGR